MSDSDDEDTPRLRPRRARSNWGDDERATYGRDFRKRTPPTSAIGYPIVGIERELGDPNAESSPYRGTDDSLPPDAELTGPSDRIMDDPIALELWGHIDNVARRAVRRHRDTGDLIAKVHQEAVGKPESYEDLVARVSHLERAAKTARAIVVTALITAIGSLVAVGKGLYERGEQEGAAATKMERLERDVDDLLHRHSSLPDRAGWLVPPSQPAMSTTAPKATP